MLGALPNTPQHINWLIWVMSRNRNTGVVEASGIWTGALSRTFTVGAENRVYHGSGAVINLRGLTMVAGANAIQAQTIELNGLTPEVEAMMRGYDPRQAIVQIHRYHQSPKLRANGTLQRALIGRIDSIEFSRDALDIGESAGSLICTVSIMTANRMGTRTLPLTKSNAMQRIAFPGDGGRKYSSSKAKVTWMTATKDSFKSRWGQM